MESPRATVIVPLYIWPCNSTYWQPLFDAYVTSIPFPRLSVHRSLTLPSPCSISAHPSVEFLIIINPSNGPGEGSLPDGQDYQREVPKLTAAPNVTTIGYVRIDYCRKPLHDACEEIDRFAGWFTKHGTNVPGMTVDGIYLDETPNHFSAGRKLYLEALHNHIKNIEGILGQRLVSLTQFNLVCDCGVDAQLATSHLIPASSHPASAYAAK
jgi:hypothetical protein